MSGLYGHDHQGLARGRKLRPRGFDGDGYGRGQGPKPSGLSGAIREDINPKTIVCQKYVDSGTKAHPFGQLSGQSYRGVQSGWKIATVVQKRAPGRTGDTHV